MAVLTTVSNRMFVMDSKTKHCDLIIIYLSQLDYYTSGQTINVPSHGVRSQGSTLRGPVAVALRLCPIRV